MSDIFISYARPDRPEAAFLAEVLEHVGYTVWWDRDLLSGEDFEQEIQRELTGARAVIVLWSTVSVRSGWVRDEASAAMERGVLVPVRLSGVVPPMGFRSLHVIEFNRDSQAELLRAVVRLTAKAPSIQVPPPTTKKTGLGLVEAVCLAVLLVAVVAFGLIMYNH